MNNATTTNLMKKSIEIIKNSQLENGVFPAAPSDDYFYAWLRDNVMVCIGLFDHDFDAVQRCIWRWLDMFIEYEWKLEHHVRIAPKAQHEFIHARYSAHDVKELSVPWSHSQNDSVGGFLYIVGKAFKKDQNTLRNDKDKEIIQKLVLYFTTMKVWQQPDSGAWEEQMELRTSSLVAVAAGLKEVKDIVTVPDILIENCVDALYELFPYETKTRRQDLAQLTAIFPYSGVFGKEMSKIIVENIEKNLLRTNGILRYQADSYYSTLEKQYGRGLPLESYIGTEAAWTFGFGYLAIAWMELGNLDKAKKYIELFESTANEKSEFPELYMADGTPNKNTPLLWTHAVYLNCIQKYEQYIGNERTFL